MYPGRSAATGVQPKVKKQVKEISTAEFLFLAGSRDYLPEVKSIVSAALNMSGMCEVPIRFFS